MSVDMFLKIDDIKGESVDDKHKDDIQVLAWSWGMSQSGSTHLGTGGGAGKVSIQDISVTKYIDTSSPVLMARCSNGEHFKKATLVVRKAGKAALEYIVMKMEDGIVSSISTGGSGGEDLLTENLTLNFAKIHIDYRKQKKDGGGEAAIEYDWNIPKNVSK